MTIWRNLKIAGQIFQTHRTRTILSVVGIIIGITSVIVIINAGESLKGLVNGQVEIFGTDYVEVEIKVPAVKQESTANAGGLAQGVSITTLKYEDGLKVKEHPNVSDFYVGVMGQEIISYQGENKVSMLMGVSDGFFRVDKNELIAGRPFTEEEDNSLATVVVLGYKIKEDLFGDEEAIGQRVKIGNAKYKVIGVRAEIGSSGFFSMDDMVLIPVQTLQKKILGIDHVSFIFGSLIDNNKAKQTTVEVTEIMREAHGITDPDKDDFAVMSAAEAMEMLDVIMNGLTLFLVAIAAISLIVGGVGIMNIMYVSVLERTYEIGLRKAVGARSKDILQQFLGEAVLITSLGGLVGVILGMLFTWAAVAIAGTQGIIVDFVVSVPGIVTACVFMIIVGLIFGIYPARKAASFDPVEALRYE